MEVDSQLLVNWITNSNNVPWSLHLFIWDLKELLLQLSSFRCYHTYREANTTTDMLAKWSHKLDVVQNYYVYQQFPAKVRGAFLLDKLGMINFQRRR